MDDAVKAVMGDRYFPIRVDHKTITANDYYVEEKGQYMFERFKHIITGVDVAE